jgi:hypothetical protein
VTGEIPCDLIFTYCLLLYFLCVCTDGQRRKYSLCFFMFMLPMLMALWLTFYIFYTYVLYRRCCQKLVTLNFVTESFVRHKLSFD